MALSTSPVTTNPSVLEERSRRKENEKSCSGRRAFFQNASFVLPMVLNIDPARALDVDAFMNKELDADNKKTQLSDDEALCKFGSPNQKTGDVSLDNEFCFLVLTFPANVVAHSFFCLCNNQIFQIELC